MPEDIKLHTDFIKFDAAHPNVLDADKLPRKWIAAAKNGQVVAIEDKLCVVTAEALKSSVGSWKDGKIIDNHETQISGFKIYADKYEDPFLYLELDEQTIKNLDEGEGGSIDAIATKVENQKLLEMRGVGYSILRPGNIPSCTREAGCAIAGEGVTEGTEEDVNIAGDNPAANINIVSGKELGNPEKVDNTKEDKKDMTDKEEKSEVVFSKEQVAEIKAAAVTDAGEQMTALHKVEMGELETAHADALKKLGETHTAEMETQRVAVQKQSALVESLGTMYALSDEAKKGLVDAKTLEDALTLFSTLKVEKAEEVVAGKGGKVTGHGITMGSEVKAEAPETIKIEQVGDWNPYTNKYEPSFREELK